MKFILYVLRMCNIISLVFVNCLQTVFSIPDISFLSAIFQSNIYYQMLELSNRGLYVMSLLN